MNFKSPIHSDVRPYNTDSHPIIIAMNTKLLVLKKDPNDVFGKRPIREVPIQPYVKTSTLCLKGSSEETRDSWKCRIGIWDRPQAESSSTFERDDSWANQRAYRWTHLSFTHLQIRTTLPVQKTLIRPNNGNLIRRIRLMVSEKSEIPMEIQHLFIYFI